MIGNLHKTGFALFLFIAYAGFALSNDFTVADSSYKTTDLGGKFQLGFMLEGGGCQSMDLQKYTTDGYLPWGSRLPYFGTAYSLEIGGIFHNGLGIKTGVSINNFGYNFVSNDKQLSYYGFEQLVSVPIIFQGRIKNNAFFNLGVYNSIIRKGHLLYIRHPFGPTKINYITKYSDSEKLKEKFKLGINIGVTKYKKLYESMALSLGVQFRIYDITNLPEYKILNYGLGFTIGMGMLK